MVTWKKVAIGRDLNTPEVVAVARYGRGHEMMITLSHLFVAAMRVLVGLVISCIA